MAYRRLRELVRFERRKAIPDDGYGNTQAEWEDLTGPLSAQIAPGNPREAVAQDAVRGFGSFTITVRNCLVARSVINGDRAVNVRSGKTYNLTPSINPDQKRLYLDFLATSGGADG